MEKMTQEQWDKMTDKEKFDFFSEGEISVQKQVGIRADSKVNDTDCCVVSFTAYCRNVQISDGQETNTAAMKQAADYIESLSV